MTELDFLDSSKNKKIICFGCGDLGKRFLDSYADRITVECFWDNDVSKQGSELNYNGKQYSIVAPSVKEEMFSDNYLFVITSVYYKEIWEQLENLGYQNIYIYPFIGSRINMYEQCLKKNISDLGVVKKWDEYKKNEYRDNCLQHKQEGFIIPYLPVMVTTKCTLKCEYCNNLMPYFKEKACDSDIEVIVDSVKSVAGISDKILFLELVGGEPFLYRKFDELLEKLVKINKIEQIVIVTNGTVIPNEKVTKLLKKYDVLIRVSDYGYLNKIVKFVQYAEENELNIWVTSSDWMYPGKPQKRDELKYDLCKQFEKCFFTMQCKYLYEGKLFHCARAASLYALEYERNMECLNVKNITADDLRRFYLEQYYSEACAYCYLFTDKTRTISPGKQMGCETKGSDYTFIRRDEWMKYQQWVEAKRYEKDM